MSKLTVKLVPTREIFKALNKDGTTYRILAVTPLDCLDELDINHKYGNITITGLGLNDLEIGVEVTANLQKSERPHSYSATLDAPPLSENPKDQWNFLKFCITLNRYNSFLECYSADLPIVDYILDLENHKDIIDKVHGMGDKTLLDVVDKINKNMSNNQIIKMLNGYEFSESVYMKIVKEFEDRLEALAKIMEENIYLLTKIHGVGFLTIDKVFLDSEHGSKTDLNRINSGIVHILNEANTGGDTTIKRSKLLNKAVSLLDVSRDKIIDVLDQRTVDGQDIINDLYKIPDETFVKATSLIEAYEEYKDAIILYNERYSSGELFVKEYYVMRNIIYRSSLECTLPKTDWDKIFQTISERDGINLSDEQKRLFHELHDSNLQFLVANGGTGKSMSQKVLLEYANTHGVSTTLLAPTGKARKKLQEYTQHTAHTIHSFLQLGMDTKLSKSSMELPLVVIDESSMIDVDLITRLFMRVEPTSKILFVGDDAQIPSVSCGNFLFDATKISERVHVSKFSKVFRQEEGGILDIITKVRKGERFLQHTFNGRKVFGKNCVFKTRLEYQQEFSDLAVETYIDLLKTYNEEDVVLLTPTNKGINGTVYINKLIQNIVNPAKINVESIVVGQGTEQVNFRVGDLIMNIKNKNVDAIKYYQGIENNFIDIDQQYLNKDTDSLNVSQQYIANGDSMKLIYIGARHAYFKLEDNLCVIIPISDILDGDIMHSWCITGHKSQGSEYKIAICIVPRQSAFQMNGNLLYTMMSRAKEYLLVLADMGVFNRSLDKFENYRRQTNLSEFLDREQKGELYGTDLLREN